MSQVAEKLATERVKGYGVELDLATASTVSQGRLKEALTDFDGTNESFSGIFTEVALGGEVPNMSVLRRVNEEGVIDGLIIVHSYKMLDMATRTATDPLPDLVDDEFGIDDAASVQEFLDFYMPSQVKGWVEADVVAEDFAYMKAIRDYDPWTVTEPVSQCGASDEGCDYCNPEAF